MFQFSKIIALFAVVSFALPGFAIHYEGETQSYKLQQKDLEGETFEIKTNVYTLQPYTQSYFSLVVNQQDGSSSYVEEFVTRYKRGQGFQQSKTFQVELSGNAELLPGETESLAVNYDGVQASVSGANRSPYNSYSVNIEEGPVTILHLEGQRKQARPNNSLDVTLSKSGDTLTMTVIDNLYEGDLISKLGQSRIHYMVERGFGKNVVKGKVAPISSRETRIQIPLDKKSKKKLHKQKFWATFSVERSGSPYFSGKSRDKKSEKVK